MPIFSFTTVNYKTKTLEDLAKKTQAMDNEHEYELKEYKESYKNMTTSKGNPSPWTPAIPLIGKGVAVLASVIIVILLAILALQIVDIAMNVVNTLSDHKDASTSNDNDLKEKVDQLNSVIRDKVQTQISAILNKTTTCVADDIEQMNITESILKTTGESAQKLMSIVNTLSNHRDTSTSTAGVVDEILLVVQELLVLHNDTADLPTSCQQIKAQNPNSPSGVYLTVPANGGSAIYTYCNMDTLCGSGGGWTRLAYLDMSDATQSCPSGFRLYELELVVDQYQTVVVVYQLQFPSNGISYSQVCGIPVWNNRCYRHIGF